MTEEELRRKIGNIVCKAMDDGEPLYNLNYADQILALIKEAGWKSPEEMEKAKLLWDDELKRLLWERTTQETQ